MTKKMGSATMIALTLCPGSVRQLLLAPSIARTAFSPAILSYHRESAQLRQRILQRLERRREHNSPSCGGLVLFRQLSAVDVCDLLFGRAGRALRAGCEGGCEGCGGLEGLWRVEEGFGGGLVEGTERWGWGWGWDLLL